MAVRPGEPDGGAGRALAAGVLYFAVAFAAGVVLGTLRTLLVMPRTGALAAVLIELPVMLAISWLACRRVVARLGVPEHFGPRLLMGLLAFALLMAAEAALGVLVAGRTLAAHLAAYRSVPELAGLAAQILFALFPVMQLGGRGSTR